MLHKHLKSLFILNLFFLLPSLAFSAQGAKITESSDKAWLEVQVKYWSKPPFNYTIKSVFGPCTNTHPTYNGHNFYAFGVSNESIQAWNNSQCQGKEQSSYTPPMPSINWKTSVFSKCRNPSHKKVQSCSSGCEHI